MLYQTKLKLWSKYRLLKRLTLLIHKGEPRKPVSKKQLEWWKKLKANVVCEIKTIKRGEKTMKLITLQYTCKSCGDTVKFTTNPTDAGAWKIGEPAMKCLSNLNVDAREMVAAMKCPKCMKPSQDIFNKA